MRPQGLAVALGEGSNNNSSSGRNSNNGRRLDYKQLNWDLLLLLRRRRLQRRARRRRIDGACLSSVFFKELCVCSEGVFGLSSSSSAVRRGASFGKNRPFWGKKEEDLEGGEKKRRTERDCKLCKEGSPPPQAQRRGEKARERQNNDLDPR